MQHLKSNFYTTIIMISPITIFDRGILNFLICHLHIIGTLKKFILIKTKYSKFLGGT